MDDNSAFIAAIALLMPVFIVLVIRLTSAKRREQGAGAVETQQMVALSESARRMERRIESLEMLLDSEVPGWRARGGVR